jgi:hypothetical protein
MLSRYIGTKQEENFKMIIPKIISEFSPATAKAYAVTSVSSAADVKTKPILILCGLCVLCGKCKNIRLRLRTSPGQKANYH